MSEIIKEILDRLPEGKISEAGFEGANIVLYTKDKSFFLDNYGSIKKIVDEFKKRIELRPDPSITMELEKAEKEIKKIVPKETILKNVRMEIHDGNTTFGRQLGTYPLIVGVKKRLELGKFYNIKIADHMLRSVTGVVI